MKSNASKYLIGALVAAIVIVGGLLLVQNLAAGNSGGSGGSGSAAEPVVERRDSIDMTGTGDAEGLMEFPEAQPK